MYVSRFGLALAAGLALLFAGCGQEPLDAPAEKTAASPATGDELVELEWDDLIPPDWRPDKIMGEYNADELEDDDPRAGELMKKLEELWDKAPLVEALNGKRVRLPGFVVPIEGESGAARELLLVPYYGACIHVPPPPPNQTVYAVMAEGEAFEGELFDTVWVTGRLWVEPHESDFGDAGYRIEVEGMEPYEELAP